MTQRVKVVLAVLLVITLGLFIWKPGIVTALSSPDGGDGVGVRSAGSGPTSNATGHPSKLTRTQNRSRPRASHSPAELKDFVIPTLEIVDGSLATALDDLFMLYNQICARTGESPLRFTYKIEGQANEGLTFTLRQTSFLAALRVIAARAGFRVDRNGTHLTFSPLTEETGGSRSMEKRSVPPDLAARLSSLLDPGSTRPEVADDPFANPADKEPAGGPKPDLLDMFRRLGVIRSAEAEIRYAPATSTLIVDGSATDQARMDAFLEELTPASMIKTSTRFIEITEPLAVPDAPLSPEAYSEFLREVSSRKGAGIMTMPSVASRPGEVASIEIIREVIPPNPEAPDESITDWTGTKMDVTSGGYGFDVQGRVAMEIRQMPDEGAPADIVGSRANFMGLSPSSHTSVVETTSPAGIRLYALVTITRIDATGRPVPVRNNSE